MNDYYCSTSLYTTVEAGESAEGELYMPVSDLYSAGVTCIGKIDLRIAAFDSESYDRIATGELVEIRTSAYEQDWQAMPNGEVIYDDNGLVVMLLDPALQESWIEDYYQYNFCFINNTDTDLRVECETFSINECELSTWIYAYVPAGKRTLDGSTFFQSDLEQYEIESPETVELVFAVRNDDTYEELFSTGSIILNEG